MKRLILALALMAGCRFSGQAEDVLGPGAVCEKDGGDDYQITCIKGEEIFLCVYNRDEVACAPWGLGAQ